MPTPSRVLRVLPLLLSAAVLGACSTAPAPAEPPGGAASAVGITPDSVTIGAHVPLTGERALGVSRIAAGALAYYSFVNDQGGVDGREIRYVLRDDAFDPAGTTTVVDELVLYDQVFALVGGAGVATHDAVLDELAEEGVPDLFPSSGAPVDAAAHPGTFGWQPDDAVQVRALAQTIRSTSPSASVGLLLPDGAEGTPALRSAQEGLAELVVAEAYYTHGAADLSSQVASLQAAGADVLLAVTLPGDTARARLAADDLGYAPQWYLTAGGADPVLVGQLLDQLSGGVAATPDPLLGVRSAQYLPSALSTADPWTRLWATVWTSTGGQGPLDEQVVQGMAQAYTFVQALQAAGPDPTRQRLVDALAQRGSSFAGAPLAPLRYSDTDRTGISGVQVVEHGSGGVPAPLTPTLVAQDGRLDVVQLEAVPPPADGIPTVSR